MGRDSIFTPAAGVGAAHDLVSADCFVEEGILRTKNGKLMLLLEVDPRDPQCQEPATSDRQVRAFEKAIRFLPPGCRLRMYSVKEESPKLPRRTSHPNGPSERLYTAHHDALAGRAGALHGYRTVFVLEYDQHERKQGGGIFSLVSGALRWLARSFSKTEKAKELDSQLTKDSNALRNICSSLIEQCSEHFKMRMLGTGEAFTFLQSLFNPDAYNRTDNPPPAEFVDIALCRSHIECHPSHLKVGPWYVTTLALKMTPASTAADLTAGLRAVSGRWVLALDCRRIEDGAARSIIELKQRQHWSNRSRHVSKMTLREKPNEERLKNHTAYAAVEDLGQAIQALEGEGHALFECSLTIVLYARSEADLQRLIAESIRGFNRQDVVVVEETLNRPASYFAHFPGNDAWNVRYQHLFDCTVADLSPLFAPDPGDPYNEHLKDSCLTVLETREKTPSCVNLHVDGVGNTVIVGQPGSGKSSLANHLVSQFQQYNPITFIFDVGGSFQPLTTFCKGACFEFGPNKLPFTLNPFAVPLTPQTRQQLNSFVRQLMGREALTQKDAQEIDQAVVSIYELEPELRTLETLASILTVRLQKLLGPWIGDGRHASYFNHNVESFTITDVQYFDFRGMRESPEVLRPLVYLLSCRIERAIADAKNRTRPKLFLNDEVWAFGDQQETRERLHREGLKTWRKYNGTVILVTQSSSDLVNSGLFEVIADCCPTKIFLPQHELDEETYARLFHLNPVELRLIRELRPRGEFLIKQPHGSQVLTLNLDAESYWLFTTNPYETKRRDEAFAAYGMTKGLAVLAQETRS